jgi:hypothetical protein
MKLTEKQIISKHMGLLSKKRHANMTKKERSEMGRKMVQARWAKYKKSHENN